MAQRLKRLPAIWETRVQSWVGKVPWRRKWPPTPVLLPGESHGQRSLVGYSPGVSKGQDTERLQIHLKRLVGIVKNSALRKQKSFLTGTCILFLCLSGVNILLDSSRNSYLGHLFEISTSGR